MLLLDKLRYFCVGFVLLIDELGHFCVAFVLLINKLGHYCVAFVLLIDKLGQFCVALAIQTSKPIQHKPRPWALYYEQKSESQLSYAWLAAAKFSTNQSV